VGGQEILIPSENVTGWFSDAREIYLSSGRTVRLR